MKPLILGQSPKGDVLLDLKWLNRHGLIAGATGSGKTRTLQLLAEGLAAAGSAVLVADLKSDLAGLAAPGELSDETQRRGIGGDFAAVDHVEFLSLTGAVGTQARATVDRMGPLLLSRVLGLNETQGSALGAAFAMAKESGVHLVGIGELQALLLELVQVDAETLLRYGAVSRATVGVVLRRLAVLKAQGGDAFFGEPAFQVTDLLEPGQVTVMELPDVEEQPAVWSSFMAWILRELWRVLPEAGDREAPPKLVVFFDEVHALFRGASAALVEEMERVVRLIRSRGVGIVFITQSPEDLPGPILAQLGLRIQHAMRAFTAADEQSLRRVAKTYPANGLDVARVIQDLAVGEALVVALGEGGVPAGPWRTLIQAPRSRMGTLSPEEMSEVESRSKLAEKYVFHGESLPEAQAVTAPITANNETIDWWNLVFQLAVLVFQMVGLCLVAIFAVMGFLVPGRRRV